MPQAVHYTFIKFQPANCLKVYAASTKVKASLATMAALQALSAISPTRLQQCLMHQQQCTASITRLQQPTAKDLMSVMQPARAIPARTAPASS